MSAEQFTPNPLAAGIAFAPWGETMAAASANLVKCSEDIAGIVRAASDAMIGGFVDYSGELSSFNSTCWASALVSGIEDGGRLLTGNASSLVKVPDSAEVMKQFQRLIEINQRLAQRQVEATSVACQALSALPSSVFGSLRGV